MSALLAFHLGPVQPFIAQARKTRDLWVGSYLLSALMRAGLREYPGRLLFPVLDAAMERSPGGGQIADLPNKFVAQHATIAEAKSAAEQTCTRIRGAWSMLAEQVWEYLFRKEQDASLRAIWERQTNPDILFEMYWAVVPYDGGQNGDESGYGPAYWRIQALLDARKRLRAFAASNEPGEKSAISGERQALYPATSDPRTFWKNLAKRFHDAQISHLGHERLDAIDAIKRFGAYANPTDSIVPKAAFPSTYALAAAPFLFEVIQRLQEHEPGGQEGLRELTQAAESWATCADYDDTASFAEVPALNHIAKSTLARRLLRCMAEAAYRTGFLARNLQDAGVGETASDTLGKNGRQALSALKRAAGANNITSPTPYFAVILLDGDHMGRLISRKKSPDEHRQLSQALSSFAHDAPRRIIEGESGLGRVVYAGGDDVLAFLPVRNALDAAGALRGAYGEALKVIAPDATASVGIVFAHRHMPLGMVLEAAREAEHAAKEGYGRDALAVSLLRRSGGITSVGAHWRYEQGDGAAALDPVQVVLEVRNRLRDGDLSPRFVYTLMEEAPILGALTEDARESEIKRLLTRQRSAGHAASFPDEAITSLVGKLAALASAFDQGVQRRKLASEAGYDLTEAGPRRGMVELSGWLLIAAFLARSNEGEDEG